MKSKIIGRIINIGILIISTTICLVIIELFLRFYYGYGYLNKPFMFWKFYQYDPEIVEHFYHFIVSAWSISTEPVCLERATISANPTAASAAATVITKKTKICPSTWSKWRAKVSRVKLTALSISSMHMNMVITFRRMITPRAPMLKRIAPSTRKCVVDTMISISPFRQNHCTENCN